MNGNATGRVEGWKHGKVWGLFRAGNRCLHSGRALGPGLLESAYEVCLAHELTTLGLAVERQVHVPVTYGGVTLECGYRIDLVVEREVVIEVKAVEKLLPVHLAQVATYLKLTGYPVGLLVNFHTASLRQGLRRLTLK
jgi:GxxExxY protein